MASSSNQRLSVAFLHPDLGLGGAERLVVDAACSLQKRGHVITLYTGYHDRNRCFPETCVVGETGDQFEDEKSMDELDVQCFGAWIPRSLCGYFHVIFAHLKMLYVTLCFFCHTCWMRTSYDVVFCDQVSSPILLLRLFGYKVFFYCHFPDFLLAPRQNCLKRFYRAPLDLLEVVSTRLASAIAVNSYFTRSIVQQTIPSLAQHHLAVLYPPIDFDSSPMNQFSPTKPPSERASFAANDIIILSINRFERKKNLSLALRAFSLVQNDISPRISSRIRLVYAGGFDSRVSENAQVLEELRDLSLELEVDESVRFLENVTSDEKEYLLSRCLFLVYTPPNEHFGIVPLEAMRASKPVVALSSGGPLESVSHGESGILVENSSDDLAKAMKQLLTEPATTKKMGVRARELVEARFSRRKFGETLESYLVSLVMGLPFQ